MIIDEDEDVCGGTLKAPFPYFGGKSRVADVVWNALGDVDTYIEPFAGSLAVLLGRPGNNFGREIVNDKDAHICNFWRALAAAPDEVARWCDQPVNETDLIARHLWLVNTGLDRIGKLEADPDFYDAKVAGWWVWGLCSWIGGEWCTGDGPWKIVDGQVVKTKDAGRGVSRQRPHLGPGLGVSRQRPHLGDAGRGVNRPGQDLVSYLRSLAARLRRVRVCCGDWSRVVTDGAMCHANIVGIFADPPYLGELRHKGCYRTDDHTISHAVREWAIAHGDDPRLRIVLAGYAAEHEALMPSTWRVHAYSAPASMQTAASCKTDGGNASNRRGERLWFSPHCRNDAPMLF